jgi:hypothetical protein
MNNPMKMTCTFKCPSLDVLAQIEHHVQNHLHGRIREFHLRTQRDGLVLRGRSSSYYAKQLAQHAIMNAFNLPISANEIEVG